MNVDLDPEIERVVLDKVTRGEYPSVEAVLEEALYLLVQRDWAECQARVDERMPWIDEATTRFRTGADQP